jgi:hypothetical protein
MAKIVEAHGSGRVPRSRRCCGRSALDTIDLAARDLEGISFRTRIWWLAEPTRRIWCV